MMCHCPHCCQVRIAHTVLANKEVLRDKVAYLQKQGDHTSELDLACTLLALTYSELLTQKKIHSAIICSKEDALKFAKKCIDMIEPKPDPRRN